MTETFLSAKNGGQKCDSGRNVKEGLRQQICQSARCTEIAIKCIVGRVRSSEAHEVRFSSLNHGFGVRHRCQGAFGRNGNDVRLRLGKCKEQRGSADALLRHIGADIYLSTESSAQQPYPAAACEIIALLRLQLVQCTDSALFPSTHTREAESIRRWTTQTCFRCCLRCSLLARSAVESCVPVGQSVRPASPIRHCQRYIYSFLSRLVFFSLTTTNTNLFEVILTSNTPHIHTSATMSQIPGTNKTTNDVSKDAQNVADDASKQASQVGNDVSNKASELSSEAQKQGDSLVKEISDLASSKFSFLHHQHTW